MTQELWTVVDQYIGGTLVPSDSALDAAIEAGVAAGLPAINVAPNQGKLLQLLARLQGALGILEIGTLGGYSTIWLARALPAGGRLIAAEPRVSATAIQTVGVKGYDGLAVVLVTAGEWSRVGHAGHLIRRAVRTGGGNSVGFLAWTRVSTK